MGEQIEPMSPLRAINIDISENRSDDVAPTMVEDEIIDVSNKTTSKFDEVIGVIEDIVVDEKFQSLQSQILEKYHHHFDVRSFTINDYFIDFYSFRIQKKIN